jgi:deoxyribodipyrimidine photo-lyase
MPSHALVWLKRDLRLHDHAALAAAAQCDSALAVFVIEPEWLQSPECDAQHVAFALQCVQALRAQLAPLGLPLLVRRGSAVVVFDELQRSHAFTHMFSHEETGPLWSYARDIRVAVWCRERGVRWYEYPQTGVVRRLKSRSGWAQRWQQRMDAPQVAAPAGWRGTALPTLQTQALPSLQDLGLPNSRPLPSADAVAAADTLHSFLQRRGREYRRDLSSPLSAEQGCSRLSVYLAFGVLSMRQIHQATEAHIKQLLASGDTAERRFAYHLRGFAGRLRWHCHFMQKIEDEPQIEERNFARAVDGLRENDFNREYFDAWCEGRTGFPMVDACMRSLNATGWLNFRMRAMLVSFASYHLWLHWRETGWHLARQFLDFEPGIHWSQMQMQSGTTGINTLRIYSPSKQMADHDPEGEFVRRWVPEWGSDAYPPPIVDEKIAMKNAKDKLYALRKTDEARAEASAIHTKHGSRKSGLPPSKPKRSSARRTKPASAEQLAQQNLFE